MGADIPLQHHFRLPSIGFRDIQAQGQMRREGCMQIGDLLWKQIVYELRLRAFIAGPGFF